LQTIEDGVEVPFRPSRVILQDFTGVPAVVDFAAMRDAVQVPVVELHSSSSPMGCFVIYKLAYLFILSAGYLYTIPSGLRIRITLMQIQIQLFTQGRIWILLLIKVMGICGH
jgi:hypothetical protein